MDADHGTQSHKRAGFTLVELLVVIAIIALLVSILMPGLAGARNLALAAKCQANMASVSRQVLVYETEYSAFPASYEYLNSAGDVDLSITGNPPGGYMHWSYLLLGEGRATDDAFSCAAMENSGAPRTNPGPDPAHREPIQTNAGNSPIDKQAPRTAFTGNAAIISRNKWTQARASAKGGTLRLNEHVRVESVETEADTVMITEFTDRGYYKALCDSDGEFTIKSHRPVAPWLFLSGSEFSEPPDSIRFFYYDASRDFGVTEVDKLGDTGSLTSAKQADAVGRHHPGGDKKWGGTANFVFVDGHGQRMHVRESMEKRLWGSHYYSMTGNDYIQR